MWNKFIRQFLEKSIVKELALLFAGVLAGGLVSLLIQKTVFDIKAVILGVGVLILFLILYGSGATSMIWNGYILWKRRLTPKVGILNDMKWDLKNGEIYTCTDISPEEWEEEIKELARKRKVKIKVNWITSEENFDSYNAIINPYGGVYPEYDLKNFKTMNKILSYINEGGLFVNVADIPCYWACNPSIEPWRRIDTALREAPYAYINKDGLVIPIKRFPLFELTPFTRELGVDVYIIEDYSNFNWGVLEFEDEYFKKFEVGNLEVKVHRAAEVKDFLDPIVKSQNLEWEAPKKPKVTPIFFVTYGDGKLLSSLIFENFKDHTEKTRNALKRMLAMLIVDFIDP
jgi:hypothetical protein